LLSQTTIEKVLHGATQSGGDFAEIFVEDKKGSSFTMTGGILEKAVSGRDFGV